MRQIRRSGLMRGDGKRGGAHKRQYPRPSSTLPSVTRALRHGSSPALIRSLVALSPTSVSPTPLTGFGWKHRLYHQEPFLLSVRRATIGPVGRDRQHVEEQMKHTVLAELSSLMSTRVRTAILLVGACTTVLGDTLVVPNIQADTPGNAPLRLGGAAVRIQEVVGGGQFTVPIVITGIHLRSAVGTGPVSSNPASVKVTISTTQAYPNTNNSHALPSLTYANNV